jgi:hypothetical protein
MMDSDEIIVLSPDETDEDIYSDEEVSETKASSSGRFQSVLLALGGGILGAALTMGAVWYLQPDPFDPSAMEARLAELQADLERLENRPAPERETVDLTPLLDRLDALEARPEPAPIDEALIARMEALQAEGFEIPEIPEIPDITALEARIAALEAELEAALVKAQAQEQAAAEAAALQARLNETVDPKRLPSFPAQTLRDGAVELSGSGLLRRTLSRHVRVGGEDSPEWLIEAISVDMRQGKARAALEKFDRLPPRLQSLARGWRADMEDALQ